MGSVAPSPSPTMSVLLLSTLVTLVAADSCTDCTAVVNVIQARLTSEESVNEQIAMLVAGLCPMDEDPAFCEENLPDFWRSIAALLWPGYWNPEAEWMCGPTCAAPEDTSMDCEACTTGIQGAMDQLLAAETIEAIIAAITPPLCADSADCAAAADFVIRNGLPLLASAADASEFPAVCNAAVEGTCPARRFAKLF